MASHCISLHCDFSLLINRPFSVPLSIALQRTIIIISDFTPITSDIFFPLPLHFSLDSLFLTLDSCLPTRLPSLRLCLLRRISSGTTASAALSIVPDTIRHHRLCGFVHCPGYHPAPPSQRLCPLSRIPSGTTVSAALSIVPYVMRAHPPASLHFSLDSLFLIPYSSLSTLNSAALQYLLTPSDTFLLPLHFSLDSLFLTPYSL